ncbi:type 11 methyltransferase [Candidatus Magnetoovum chiemensis]|nr:type 11 methyltransferase [Candidatus Magnetoovum chiemensis]
MTWQRATSDVYLKRLLIDKDYFKGKSVLDIGCGPHPRLLAFQDCRRYGLDQLINEYKTIGYPLDKYSEEITYLTGSAEAIPTEDNFFDAVIAVNSLDHIDNFDKAAMEIKRVLKNNGILRIEVSYRKRGTTTEPLVLNDDKVISAFGSLNIKKIQQRQHQDGKVQRILTIWSNQ